ncbi:shikimate dehydrogenase family protein [Pseudooceanicola nanhaiensis]|uniref:shikimate dehydrogenase family protein n=1 Tax=Pseudooceanicola nanhaiensis TaxID=375761 RepID=UPI001CD7BAD4|nr:shikimate dehydrogenase [Pseudooceanicola nanhaiensis]MCA0921183.1 shikimate dehydrogenase [Pseudooceanicola nanhaiensis]
MTQAAPDLLLGLIGDNIAKSRSPLLHQLVGRQNDMVVRYDRLIPREQGKEFDELFAWCPGAGYRGINVTYPYKERAFAKVTVEDPLVRSVGAVNTVLFDAEGAKGHNTDFSGFMAAYRAARGETPPGAVLMIGTGGVGRAVAFGLLGLGAPALRLVDRDLPKAEALAEELRATGKGAEITVHSDAAEAAEGAQGLINCTPVGMVGYEGTPLPAPAMAGAEWVFDAVYTPTDTQFLQDAEAAGLQIISGWELFFWQGVHAWTLFSDGKSLDTQALRAALLDPATTEQ